VRPEGLGKFKKLGIELICETFMAFGMHLRIFWTFQNATMTVGTGSFRGTCLHLQNLSNWKEAQTILLAARARDFPLRHVS
jgi:hypothetical protein